MSDTAWKQLRQFLLGDISAVDFDESVPVPYRRAASAFADTSGRVSSLDMAVLLRHAIVHRVADQAAVLLRENSFDGNYSSLLDRVYVGVPHDHLLIGVRSLELAGFSLNTMGGAFRLRTKSWHPEWLQGTSEVGPDWIRDPERLCRQNVAVAGDPFLKCLGFQHYRSAGQRVAIRSALAMPQGSTLLIDLPTGDGKSAVFGAIARIGFARDEAVDGTVPGVTLVVVPTITLALDLERRFQQGDNAPPAAYIGGDEERKNVIRERIRSGEQGLCFAAPESAVEYLSPALKFAAERGFLRALVVDEAHLVEAWGTGFRTSFQYLAALRRELLAADPRGRLRTVLLSATYSSEARILARTLFGGPGEYAEVNSGRLRPEPVFWVAESCDPEVRERRVCDALLHLPRPAILYVTRRKHAQNWFGKLQSLGFERVRVVDGSTDSTEREDVLRKLSGEQLDLIVGTSAFGMGIDYPHIRSVVHACVPESLDRFYQEVGRGGRDGLPCLSVLIPTAEDFEDAKKLSKKIVISVKRGHERWRSMFRNDSRARGNDRFSVNLAVQPGTSEGDIDMLNERNTDWNARVLSLMARAELLRFEGSTPLDEENTEEAKYVDVTLLREDHLELDCWKAQVGLLRHRIQESNRANLAAMTAHTRGGACISQLLAGIYRLDPDSAPCTECNFCRAERSCRSEGYAPTTPAQAWPTTAEVHDPLAEFFQKDGVLLVFGLTEPRKKREVRRFQKVVHRIFDCGVRNVSFVGFWPQMEELIYECASKRSVYCSHGLRVVRSQIPGPSLIIYGPDANPTEKELRSRSPGQERVFLLRSDTPDPTRRQVRLFDSCSLPLDNMDSFRERLLS
ncbi:protein DpdF [Myxococcota bacterium]